MPLRERGQRTTLESLNWEAGVVTMELTHYVPLAGYRIDFIALDGSWVLSLEFDGAKANNETGTFTWLVPDQPWQDGDQLMLRVRESG